MNRYHPRVLALLLEDPTALSGFFTKFGYLAPFTVLLLCGFGLPIPEEVTMLGSGFLLYQGRVEALPIIGVCLAGTLLGDSVPFWLGRIYGQRALKVKAVRRILHPERLRALRKSFRRSGSRAVFVCRFLPGVRLPAWFTAGTLNMRYPHFLAIDALGAMIMTPTFVALGYASGEKIAELESTVENLHQILGFVVLSLAAVLIFHLLVTRRWTSPSEGGRRPRPADDDEFDGDRP